MKTWRGRYATNSICYKDLKPLHEDLQVISLCRHVFHQLCLRQWMVYCARSRKRTCPVCKQVCADMDVERLYFQSAGDMIGGGVRGEGEEVEVRLEVKGMEAKFWGLGLEVERWKKDVERLNDEALKQLPREKIQLATKFGIVSLWPEMTVKGTPEYVRSCCEASLKRLGVEYIDLYYQHRVDRSIPIEETMGELKKLVKEGEIKYVSLSEASPDTIRRAHGIHPTTAVQMEWSLWTRDIEDEIIPLCRK